MLRGFYFCRMKNFIPIIFACALIFIASCKTEPKVTNSGFQLYSSDSLGFSIEYPETFETKAYFNQFIPISFFETITDSTTDQYPENLLVNIEKIPVAVPFADFVTASKTQLKLMMPELTIYEEDSISIDGYPTAVYKFYRPKKDSTNFVSKMFVVFQKDRAVNFSCTGISGVFDSYEPIFDKIVKSVKFNKK